ncbi:hypothetical protein [Streptomyces sp. NPDC007205]|uniref:hypothetical protein n=1 Tax=Streptomyces sp. NPDC007205 TaxID=3154316 RepID=UPI0033CFB23A
MFRDGEAVIISTQLDDIVTGPAGHRYRAGILFEPTARNRRPSPPLDHSTPTIVPYVTVCSLAHVWGAVRVGLFWTGWGDREAVDPTVEVRPQGGSTHDTLPNVEVKPQQLQAVRLGSTCGHGSGATAR